MMMRSIASLLLLAGLASASAAQTAIQAPGHDLPREGTAERRAMLNRMELRDFDHTRWQLLKDWSGGEPLTAANTAGKVVLVYTFTNYISTSLRPLATVARLQERFGEQGLIVVGVHPDTGWADAASTLATRKASFRIARDAGDEFRKALLVDEDPDFYLIDRAGQMRFADLETSAITRAVELLVAESEKDARSLRDRLKDEQAEADRLFGQPQRIRQEVRLSDIPELPFAEPTPEIYAAVKWPKFEPEDANQRNQQPPPPATMPAFEEQVFIPAKPPTKGRATVAYFFNPKIYQTYAFLEEANRLQAAHERDIVVLAVMTPRTDPNNRFGNNTPTITPEQWVADLTDFITTRRPKHTLLSDITGSFAAALTSNQFNRGNDAGVLDVASAPYVAVVSSDGIIRWHGSAGSRWFRFALDEVLRLDPGIAARREVEVEFRRAREAELSAQPVQPQPTDEQGDE